MMVKKLQYLPYEAIFTIEKQKLESMLLSLLEESKKYEHEPKLSNIRSIENHFGIGSIRNIIEKSVRSAPKSNECGIPYGEEWADLDLSIQAEGYRRISEIVNAMSV